MRAAMLANALPWPLARQLIRREWAHHPWRHAVALLAVALGVALAWSVHLVNSSALAEFAGAVRSANGEPDLSLRGQRAGFDEAVFERAALDAAVAAASPVVERESYLRRAGERQAVRVLGVDALRVAPVASSLLPRPAAGEAGTASFDPALVFVNAALRARGVIVDGHIELQAGPRWQRLRVAGDVAAAGPPLVVLDIAAAQDLFESAGRVTRIDLRLAPGADRAALVERLQLPPGVQAVQADDGEQRVSNLSRAYRVNLTVLALVALFVGAFLVYSVQSLSVAQRAPALALLGVLGLTAGERRRLVLLESLLLGAAGSALGLLLGTALAQGALHWLAGDLGGGYFPGIAPQLVWSAPAALAFGSLGTASALAGAWWPARAAEALPPAQALKGLGVHAGGPARAAPGLVLLGAGVLLALLPPLAGLPLAAYGAVAALLFGGVALVPVVVAALLNRRAAPRQPLLLLAWRRAHMQRASATAAVSGVVTSLALGVALTVMVASFRGGVASWLDQVLPADLYARSAGSAAAAEVAWLPEELLARAATVPGVQRVAVSRVRSLQLARDRPAVTLVARALADAQALPLVGPALPAHGALPDVFVSEAMVALHGARPGSTLVLPLDGALVSVHVRGVWRDYARQFGSIAIELDTYRRLSGDRRITDLALWLAPGTRADAVQTALRALLPDPALLDFAEAGELRRISLAIFDRSFAVTHYLQVLAIAIGLVGIAASLSAQVLARRKEFGLLSHLGLTRRQIITVVCGEAAAWLAAGTLLGLALGAAVSVVLVHVVNPQSFHWSMALVWPLPRLAALATAVLLAGVATAAFAARGASARSAVLSVKEDW